MAGGWKVIPYRTGGFQPAGIEKTQRFFLKSEPKIIPEAMNILHVLGIKSKLMTVY